MKVIANESPLIIDIKRNSWEDGPGIRTVIFFKGCPLSCIWCHNPEAISKEQEIGFFPKKCISCFECKKICPKGAITIKPLRIERDLCNFCGICVDACPSKAIRIIGKFYEVDKLIELILLDKPFYDASNGGITISGGEPTLFPDYVGELLKTLKANDVHTLLQTSGLFEYSCFKDKLLPYLDVIYYDIKLIDPILHYKFTGSSNQIILKNLISLQKEGIDLVVRTPLIPRYTDIKENLDRIKAFLLENAIKEHILLPYNPLYLWKYT
ncbi:TPA: glycyl-radical enzyme activating protein [bacterium]|nr:glycyl-radical enzyme activating protein [bacterium]